MPTEFEETKLLAAKLLDEPNADPDDIPRMLSRQFLRQVETVTRLKKDLASSYDPTGDLIQANRDEILNKHEEAIRRIRACVLREDCIMALAVIDALNHFHPMHCESWQGWPEGSN